MGLFDGVKKFVQSGIDIARGEANSDDWKRFGTGLVTGGMAGPLGITAGEAVMSGAPEPTMTDDARIKALRERAYKDYQDFSQNMPAYKQGQMRPEIMRANMAEQQGHRNVRRGASRRGLLHSGIRQKGEADVTTQKANTLAEARFNINRQANELADLKRDIATGIGISDTAALNQAALDAQARARDDAARRRQAYQQIGQGLGYAAGSMYSPQTAGTGEPTGLMTMNYQPDPTRMRS